MSPWTINSDANYIYQLIEQQLKNKGIPQFFDICKIVKYWPEQSRELMFQFFCKKSQADIKKVLRIINLAHYAIDNTNKSMDDKLNEIWFVLVSVFNRCNVSYENLTNIFELIQHMERTALNLAWMHLMDTFTNKFVGDV